MIGSVLVVVYFHNDTKHAAAESGISHHLWGPISRNHCSGVSCCPGRWHDYPGSSFLIVLPTIAHSPNELYHRPISVATAIPTSYLQPQPNKNSLTFVTASSDMPPEICGSGDEVIHLLPDTFLASSENGFSLSRSDDGVSESAWRCTVAGGLASLEWPCP